MRKVFYFITSKIISFLFVIFIIIFFLSCFLTTNYLDFGQTNGYYIAYESGFSFFYFVLFVLFFMFILLLNKKSFFGIKENQILIFEILFFFVSGICLIIMHYDVSLESDSRNVMDAAFGLFSGDYTVLDFKSYMNANPNNFGLFTMDYILLKLFKNVLTVTVVFRLINLVFCIFLYVYLYKITDLLFNNHTINMNLLLIFLGFNQLVFSSMFVYGNVMSYSLAVISVYYLLKFFKTNKLFDLSLSIISIILSIFIRRNSLIILIAEAIYIFLYIIKTRKIVFISLVPLVGILLFISTTGIEKYYGSLVNYDYSETSMPTITWVAYGLNYDKKTPGRWFSEYDEIHVANNFETDLIKVEAKQFIDSAINAFAKNPKLAIEFFANKFSSSWSDPRYDSFTRSHNTLHPLLEEDSFQDSLTCYWDAWLTIMSIGLILLLITKFDFKLEYMLPALCVIGGFLFHSFWEVKALYCYQYVLLLLPYAAFGLSKITQFLKR